MNYSYVIIITYKTQLAEDDDFQNTIIKLIEMRFVAGDITSLNRLLITWWKDMKFTFVFDDVKKKSRRKI